MARQGVTRREVFKGAAAVALAAAWPDAKARAQGLLANLAPEEPVEKTLQRLFGSRPIKDGSQVITLELPLIAEDGGNVAMSVEVKSPMTPQSYVKHIYVVADKNRIPIVTRAVLTPESGQAYMGANIRLGESGDVRAIVEQSDGTLLQVKREVKVTVGGCGG